MNSFLWKFISSHSLAKQVKIWSILLWFINQRHLFRDLFNVISFSVPYISSDLYPVVGIPCVFSLIFLMWPWCDHATSGHFLYSKKGHLTTKRPLTLEVQKNVESKSPLTTRQALPLHLIPKKDQKSTTRVWWLIHNNLLTCHFPPPTNQNFELRDSHEQRLSLRRIR